MNAHFVAAATALVLAGSADAAESVPLQWECARAGAPSLHETAATYGYDNYARVVPARDAPYRQVRRACARGADRVVVLGPDAARPTESRMASR